MKEGWVSRRLDELCHFTNGLWKGEKPPFINVGVIRNTNFGIDGILNDSDIAFIEVELKKFEKRRLQCGDIILEKSGGGPKQPVGRIVLFDKKEGDFSFSNFTAALRVKNSDELNFRFLHKSLYWIYQSGVTEGMQSHSTGIRNLDGDKYKAIELPVPPLSEQHRIVEILDKAFADIAKAKANAEQNLRNARELFESQLNEVFQVDYREYDIIALSELVSEVTDGDHQPPPKSLDGIPFITIGNIIKDTRQLDFSSTFKVPRSYFASLKTNRRPQRGDVLYTVTGSFGIPVLIDSDWEFCFQRHIGLIRPKTDTDSRWICYLLLSPQVYSQAAMAATGTAQKTVSLRSLRSLRVPRLPVARQQQQADQLDVLSAETQRLTRIYERKLVELEALKKSILHKAFSGEL